MNDKRRVNLPKPATPAQVALDIVNLGGLVEFRALCNAHRRPTASDGVTWHDCTGCWGVFLESELSAETGLCEKCERGE